MAKVTIDESICTGCGICEADCPEAFKVGDDAIARVSAHVCASCDLTEVASLCPVNAIIVK